MLWLCCEKYVVRAGTELYISVSSYFSNKTPSNTPKRGSVKKSKKMNGPQVKTRPLDAPVTLAGWLYKFVSITLALVIHANL